MGRATDPLLIRGAVAAGVLALVAALALARARRVYEPPVPRLPDDAFPPARERAPLTAFYFTSRLCAECQETPRVVREAGDVPVVPLWVHERPDLVRALGVYETPTLLLADAEGRIRYARVGNPDPAELSFYIAEALLSSAPRASPARA